MIMDIDDLIEQSRVKIRLLENGRHLAQASVNIAGFGWEIRNFLIGETDSGDYWVMPPHWGSSGNRHQGANYHTFINNDAAWQKLVDKIKTAYKKEVGIL